MNKILLILFILLLLTLPVAQAGRYEVNGTSYVQTWDGRSIDIRAVDCPGNNCPYLVQDNGTHKTFSEYSTGQAVNVTWPKINASFRYDIFKIHPSLTYSKSLLANSSVVVNVSTAYLVFPYSLSKLRDRIDDDALGVGGWTFNAGSSHISIFDDNKTQNTLSPENYTFLFAANELRVYYKRSAANVLQGNITFQMNSWSVNGSTTPTWQNTSASNITYMDVTAKIGMMDEGWERGNTNGWVTEAGSSVYTDPQNSASGLYGGKFNGSVDKNVNFSFGKNLSSNFSVAFKYKYSGFNEFTDSRRFLIRDFSLNNMFLLTIPRNFTTYTALTVYDDVSYRQGLNNTENTWFSTVIDVFSNSTGSDSVINISVDGIQTNVNNGTVGSVKYFSNITVGSQNQETTDITYIDDIRIWNTTAGNMSLWHDSRTGNEIHQINVNATTPANTNYSVSYRNNGTGNFVVLGTNQTHNQSFTISGTKYQDTEINITLTGNNTETPELVQVTFFDQAVAGGEPTPSFIPPSPVWISNTSQGLTINRTWTNGTGNITNSYNVTIINSTGTHHDNGSSLNWSNNSIANATWSNITIWAWNTSIGNLSSAGITNETYLSSPAAVWDGFCRINVDTNATVHANDSAISCSPTNGSADGNMQATIFQSAVDDWYRVNMSVSNATHRIFNETSNNASLGVSIAQAGLTASAKHQILIYNRTHQIAQFWATSNSSGHLNYNTSIFDEGRYTTISENAAPNPIIYVGVVAIIIGGIAYYLRRIRRA